MSWKDPGLLAEIRARPRCEYCNAYSRYLVVHHLMTRGAGWVDIPENLCALDPFCHTLVENVVEAKDRLWHLMSLRDGISDEERRERVWWVRRQPKGTPDEVIREGLERIRRRKGA